MAKKEEKDTDLIKTMIAEGLQVKDVVFVGSVRSTEGPPITELHDIAFYEKSNFHPDHRGRMWLTPIGLVCMIKSKSTLETVVVPTSNLKYFRPF